MEIKTINHWKEIPECYSGIINFVETSEFPESIFWLKNGRQHREDGPAIIDDTGYKRWYLNDKFIWSSLMERRYLKDKIILSKNLHPEYPTVQIWKWIEINGMREQIMIPGMEYWFIE